MSSISVGQTLSPVTTAGGLYPQLDQQIIQVTMPFMYARQIAATRSIAGQPGQTYTFARQTGSRTAVFSEIAPGAFIPVDSTPYGYSAVTVYKIAEGFVVTRELVEDTYLPVIQDHMVRFGVRAANKIDLDIWKAIIAGATTSSATTGNSLGSTGTTFGAYRGGAIGQQDIVQTARVIKAYNYLPTDFAINPIQEQDLYMLPQFTLSLFYGTSITREGTPTAQPSGEIYGTKLTVSNNIPAGTAVMVAGQGGKNPLNQYAPGIFFVEKRPLQTVVEEIGARDAQGVYFTARYAPSVQRGETIALITGLAQT
jgi:hypothetical protein